MPAFILNGEKSQKAWVRHLRVDPRARPRIKSGAPGEPEAQSGTDIIAACSLFSRKVLRRGELPRCLHSCVLPVYGCGHRKNL